MGRRSAVAAIAAGLALVTATLALADPAPASPWRHAYLVPVVGAALAFGLTGGLLTALAAVMLFAPFVLPDLERAGPTAAAVEGLVTFAVLLGTGGLAGALAGEAGRQRERYRTALAVQRTLAADAPLDIAVPRLAACLARRLRATAVGLVVRDGQRLVVVGGAGVAPGSPVALTLEREVPVFVADAAGAGRPRRVLAVPLLAGGRAIGALALERVGDIGGSERAAVETLAAHVALALENARLASLQRRFAEDLSQKVAAATGRLEEMDRLKSEFVAVASHELRTPLTALHGFSELLATRRFSRAEVRRLAEIMRGETERLARIVSDFLDLSRLERGLGPVLRKARLDVEVVLAGALELFRRTCLTHRLDVECAGPLPPVDADPDALDRIAKNLVSNAIKYSPRGSRILVRARAVPGAVVIDVEDEGPGIPPEELARVFEPYYRTPGALLAARGAGIGLAVVKSLVEAHGGWIRAEGAPGGGTRMTLALPTVP